MQIQPQTAANTNRNCLGCADCKGLCRAIVELASLPEMVLHRSSAAP